MQLKENFIPKGFPDDCASCDGKYHCFKNSPTITLKAHGKKPKDVTVDTVADHVEEPFVNHLVSIYGVCPWPVIHRSPDASHLYNLVHALEGTSRCRMPQDIYELPALYIQACFIIGGERERIRRFRAEQTKNGINTDGQ